MGRLDDLRQAIADHFAWRRERLRQRRESFGTFVGERAIPLPQVVLAVLAVGVLGATVALLLGTGEGGRSPSTVVAQVSTPTTQPTSALDTSPAAALAQRVTATSTRTVTLPNSTVTSQGKTVWLPGERVSVTRPAKVVLVNGPTRTRTSTHTIVRTSVATVTGPAGPTVVRTVPGPTVTATATATATVTATETVTATATVTATVTESPPPAG